MYFDQTLYADIRSYVMNGSVGKENEYFHICVRLDYHRVNFH